METAFWIFTAVVALVYVSGWLIQSRNPSEGNLLRKLGLLGTVAIIVWAAIIDFA